MFPDARIGNLNYCVRAAPPAKLPSSLPRQMWKTWKRGRGEVLWFFFTGIHTKLIVYNFVLHTSRAFHGCIIVNLRRTIFRCVFFFTLLSLFFLEISYLSYIISCLLIMAGYRKYVLNIFRKTRKVSGIWIIQTRGDPGFPVSVLSFRADDKKYTHTYYITI